MPPWLTLLTQASILGYALLAGVFLAFSDFLMRALARSSGGLEAMQSINREVFRYVFMALFLGMAPVSLVLAIAGGGLITAAGVTYLVGAFALTVVANVPLNDALARHAPTSPDAMPFWTGTYLPRWTFWNSIRAVACLAAAVMLLAAT